jgi:hypothetical protein
VDEFHSQEVPVTYQERDWRPAQASHLVIQQLDEELLIYDTVRNKAHCLNSSMREVWERCDGHSSFLDIVKSLSKKNGKAWNADIVRLALKQLVNKRLLENHPLVTADWKHVSRRHVMKKIGVGALVALPVIASVAIPTPAEAASCLGLLQPCTTNAQCCSGNCGVQDISLVCLP